MASRSNMFSLLAGLLPKKLISNIRFSLALIMLLIGQQAYATNCASPSLGGSFAYPFASNALGQVIGTAQTTSGDTHAFLCADDTTKDLGTLGGKYSDARGINNLGQVVGESTIADGSFRPYLYSNGVMLNLGSLGGRTAAANAINDQGWVVGTSELAGPQVLIPALGYEGSFLILSLHAILWTPRTGLIDLNSLWTGDRDMVLQDAWRIDNDYNVTGMAAMNNGTQVLYTINVASVPEPETYSLILAGLGLLSFVALRKKK